MFRPSELQAFLDQIGTKAKKGLSQNFLIDGNILNKIIAVSQLKEGERVLEIGPGPGALTRKLLEAGAQVVAVEKDTLFAANLPNHPHLKVLAKDIRDFKLEELHLEGEKAKIVANLPYHLTSLILGMFVPYGDVFCKLVVMVQHEVALRMTAKAGSPDYSSLSVFLQYYGKLTYAFKVGRSCFSPAPKIDSAIVVIDLEYKIAPEGFFPFVRQAFQQKRKMLTTSLKNFGKENVQNALTKIGVKPEARPSTLTVEQWVNLYESLTFIAPRPRIEP